jgi:hypothetical protein
VDGVQNLFLRIFYLKPSKNKQTCIQTIRFIFKQPNLNLSTDPDEKTWPTPNTSGTSGSGQKACMPNGHSPLQIRIRIPPRLKPA